MVAAVEATSTRLLIDDGVVAAVVVDDVGRVTEATVGASALLGRRTAELLGRNLDDIVVPGWGWVVRNSMLRLASGSLDEFELLLRGRSGRRSLVRMSPQRAPARAAQGGPQQYMLIWIEQRADATRKAVGSTAAQLKRHAYGLLKTHEAELGRVASELHDGVAPLVVMAKFMIEGAIVHLARGEAVEATDLMTDTVARLREVLAEVRRISTELRPSSLDDLGLLPTIEWHCRIVSHAYQALQVATALSVDESAIPDALKLDIFRIVQEALNNVVRHAQATEARVTLRATEGQLELSIEDNGVGFDVEAALRGTAGVMGLGLHSIRKRVDATRGALRLESSPRQGTLIDATWPLPVASAS